MAVFKPVLWAALALAPLAVFAQETPAPAAPASVDDRTYTRETNGDWDLQCLRLENKDAEEPCQMYQLITDGQGAPVMEATFFKFEGRGIIVAGANITVPLETLLTEKLSVQVDDGPVGQFDFAFCTQFGCYARLGLTEEDVTRFKKGAVAKLSIVPALAPDQRVTLDLSLTGFTASFAKVSTRR